MAKDCFDPLTLKKLHSPPTATMKFLLSDVRESGKSIFRYHVQAATSLTASLTLMTASYYYLLHLFYNTTYTSLIC